MCFIPMNLSQAYPTTNKSNVGSSLRLAPSPHAILFSQPSASAHAWSGSDCLNLAYFSNYFKFDHANSLTVPITSTNPPTASLRLSSHRDTSRSRARKATSPIRGLFRFGLRVSPAPPQRRRESQLAHLRCVDKFRRARGRKPESIP